MIKKAQFTSPIIILGIIIISALLISIQTRIITETRTRTIQEAEIIRLIQQMQSEDLNYQNNLTIKTISLLSTINDSNIITSILQEENAAINFSPIISIKYSRNYGTETINMTINNTIIIPYPYAELLVQEQRFNRKEFKTCLETKTCPECVNEYDTGQMNWEPVICYETEPARVKIRVEDAENPLTKDNPYILWNNSFIIIQ